MEKKSYKIKHDFLFDVESLTESSPFIPKLDCFELKLSNVLKAKDYDELLNLLNLKRVNCHIIDDIVCCINPQSEIFKKFIIGCIAAKLAFFGIKTYL